MEELIHKLGVEWKLLIAQIINFCVLVFILKKFLYTPLAKFMDARKEKIIKGLEKAQKGEQEFEKIQELKDRELAKIQKRAEKIIQKAKEVGSKKQQEILNIAEEKTKKIILEAKNKIKIEREEMLKKAQKDIAQLVIASTEKILQEKINEKREKQLINKTFNKLKEYEA